MTSRKDDEIQGAVEVVVSEVEVLVGQRAYELCEGFAPSFGRRAQLRLDDRPMDRFPLDESRPMNQPANTLDDQTGGYQLDELLDIERDLHEILDRLPAERGAVLDAKGRPALAVDCQGPNLLWSKPLGDPFGGTDLANGRHPVKMFEPTAAADAPKEVVYLILGSLQFSEAALRVYGHPQLLAPPGLLHDSRQLGSRRGGESATDRAEPKPLAR